MKKILLCHNFYQKFGGEDRSFESEAGLLQSHGHKIIRYTVHNDSITGMGRMRLAARTMWNGRVYEELQRLIRLEKPWLMHCTNIFPLISPSAYYAARSLSVPVVQSLRNYRLLCANGCFLRNSKICEVCLKKRFPWLGFVNGCYRSSRLESAVAAAMVGVHSMMKTWVGAVDRFFTPTEFSRHKFIEGGLPAEKIAVKPSFLNLDPGPGEGGGRYALFVGRLSPEKGIDVLLSCWSQLGYPLSLKIVGVGPLAEKVKSAAGENGCVEWLGWKEPDEVLKIVGDAACLIIPSICYETFGRTIMEAYAKGTPVVASRLGAMAELVHDGRTGVLFEAGNGVDLAAKVSRLFDDPANLQKMRRAARQEFLSKYTADINYRALIKIYGEAARTHSIQGY